MTNSISNKICDLLIKRNIVPEDLIDRCKEESDQSKKNITEILVDKKMVSSEDVLIILSEVLSFPPIRLSQYNIDMEILKLIPRKISYSYLVLPISRIGKQLTVAMVDPLNIFALDDLRIMTNLEISPVLVTKDDIMEALASYYEKDSHDELSELVEDMRDGKMEMVSEEESTVSSMELLRITEEAPVVKMTNMIMARAVKERASDIMIEPMEDRIRVRYRVDGVLHESFEPPKKFHQAIISRIKVMSDLDIAERRLPQDGRFRIKLEGRKVDFRVAIVPSSFGEKCALRILDKEQARTDLNALGFKERSIEKIQKAAKKPHGMLLVCGPTGCGKTTTLYSILKYVEDPELNLITVEDPVEFELKGINQVQVNEELGLTFAGCLRSILRQDPDIIMVGEIRDFTTLDVAIKSALTGHLVLSTLHTNTSAESIVRMINMGIEPFLICSSIELIAAQRLLRKLCSDCKELYEPAPDIAEQYGLFDDNGDIKKIYKPRGCPRCGNTGYKGRVGIVECLELTDPIKDLIFKDAQASEIEVEARKEGMKTLRENGIENVLEGLTSLEDVLRMTIAPKETV